VRACQIRTRDGAVAIHPRPEFADAALVARQLFDLCLREVRLDVGLEGVAAAGRLGNLAERDAGLVAPVLHFLQQCVGRIPFLALQVPNLDVRAEAVLITANALHVDP
jgi:hypothetical protein